MRDPSATSAPGGAALLDGRDQPASLTSGRGSYIRQFDLFRTITFVGVVAQHSVLWPVTGSSPIGWGLVMDLHATRNAFFFLSAFLACYSQATRPRSRKSLWYRRLTQVLVPYLVWTAIYFAYTMINTPAPFGSAMHVLWTDLWTGYYQLYFVVVLIQFYVLLPALLWLVRVTRGHHGLVFVIAFAFQLAMDTCSHYLRSGPGSGVPGTLHHVASILLQSRLIIGYELYLVAGLLAAAHAAELERLVARYSRQIVAGAVIVGLAAEAFYGYGLSIGQEPGRASDLYSPEACAWFMAAIAGLCALGWQWAQRAARRSTPNFTDRLFTWGSDVSGGFYFSHVLVLQLVLMGLDRAGLRAATTWGVVSIVLFVCTIGGTSILVTILLRTPLRFILTGPNRTEERAKLPWHPSPSPSPSAGGRAEAGEPGTQGGANLSAPIATS